MLLPTDNQEGRPHTVNVDGVDRLHLWVGVDDPDPVCKAKKYADGSGAVMAWCGRRALRGEKVMIGYQTWGPDE